MTRSSIICLSPIFGLPEKSVSKTILVYGVPVTAAIEVGGNGEAVLIGNAILDSNIQFEKILVNPNLNVTLSATASLSAVFGLAKLGVNASPLTELQLKILYITVSGTNATFGGRITIPIKVIGSIFWGVGSGTLASTSLGPYTFGTFTGAPSMSPADIAAAASTGIPEFFSTSAITISGTNKMIVYTKNTGSSGSPSPDVYYTFYNGTSWSSEAAVAAEAPLWEMDPAVTFLSGTNTLAVWTSNDGDPGLTDLTDILSHQDIRYSLWNGSTWSTPGYVLNDSAADGASDVSYDAVNQKAVAVWLHDGDSDITTRTDWEIYYAIFDDASDTWGTAASLSGTDTSADYMPAVASSSTGGKTMAVWAHDTDGNFFSSLGDNSGVNGTNVDYTNTDGTIYYAVYDGTTWNTPSSITGSNNGSVSFPSAAWNSDGAKAVVVWTGKAPDSLNPGQNTTTLYYSIYTVSGDSWSTPAAVVAANNLIEAPSVFVDSSDNIKVIWRSTADGPDGDIYKTTITLAFTDAAAPDTGMPYAAAVSAPTQVTKDNKVDWNLSAAIDSNGEIFSVWRKDDFNATADLSSSGLSGNLNFARAGSSGASFTGATPTVSLVNGNLRVMVETNIASTGNYGVYAELYDSSGNRITTTSSSATGISGVYTFTLDFWGGYISQHNVDGPYTIKNITLFDENGAQVVADSASSDITTSAYIAGEFAAGRVTFNKSSYVNQFTTASITVVDSDLNTDAGTAQTIDVMVTSEQDTTGITVTLAETEINSGVFSGTIGFSMTASDDTNDLIKVTDYSTITVIYNDQTPITTWYNTAIWYETLDPFAVPIPTLTEWAVILLILLMAAIGIRRCRS